MTNSMKKLLESLYSDISTVNYLLSLGVIDMNESIDSVIETKNCHLIYAAAKNIKNAPVEKLVDALVNLLSSDEHKNGRWDYLVEIAKEVESVPFIFKKIVDILIQKSKVYEAAANQLPELLCTEYDQDKLISAIIASKNFYAIAKAQKILNYKNDAIVNMLLESNEYESMLFINLFDTIVNGYSKYIPKLVIHMKEVFSEKYLSILLHPNAIFKIKKSLDEEEAKKNSQYLNILYNFLKKELKQLEGNAHRYEHVRNKSEHHNYLFSPNFVSLEDWDKIFVSCKNIINKIEGNRAFIESLNDEKKFNHLMNLCERGSFEPIVNNLEVFRTLFHDSSSAALDGKDTSVIRTLTKL